MVTAPPRDVESDEEDEERGEEQEGEEGEVGVEGGGQPPVGRICAVVRCGLLSRVAAWSLLFRFCLFAFVRGEGKKENGVPCSDGSPRMVLLGDAGWGNGLEAEKLAAATTHSG